jgi:hypothetical protein
MSYSFELHDSDGKLVRRGNAPDVASKHAALGYEGRNYFYKSGTVGPAIYVEDGIFKLHDKDVQK